MIKKYKQILISPLISFVNLLRQLCWRILKSTTIGIRLLLLTNKEVLLVKHSYLNQWFLPGGEAKAKETIKEALEREIKEELGVEIEGKIQILGIYSNFQEHKRDYIIVFFTEGVKIVKPTITLQNFEIKDIKYFPLEVLPLDTSPGTRKRIQEFLDQKASEIFIKEW